MKGLVTFCIIYFINHAVCRDDDRFRPKIHFSPMKGKMGGISGFNVFDRTYHLFYQHNPNSSTSIGRPVWGHAISPDFFTWEHLPSAITPQNDSFSTNGTLSGSAFVEGSSMFLYYTGNTETPSRLLRPSIKRQRQAVKVSADGKNFFDSVDNPIIKGDEFQPDFRHPKVWKHRNMYYMVVGNSANGRGRALLYSSKDKFNWGNATVLLESNGTHGSMWENVDLFEMQGRNVLIASIRGMTSLFNNTNKNTVRTGYFVGKVNYNSGRFIPTTDFKDLDNGFDLYATQTFLDRFNRRVLIALLSMDGQTYPEAADGRAGIACIPRELSLTRQNVLTQTPVSELRGIRDERLQRGNYRREAIRLVDQAGEFNIRFRTNRNLVIRIDSDNLLDRVTFRFNATKGEIEMNRRGLDGTRIAPWKPTRRTSSCDLIVDISVVELFCENGEVTISGRIFPRGHIKVSAPLPFRVRSMTAFTLKRTVPGESSEV